MSDDVKAALERARIAFGRVHRYATNRTGAVPYMSIPADRKRDADLLHVDALDALEKHIDGEPARTAEAVARAREEQREACAVEAIDALVEAGEDPRAADVIVGAIRATPLDATPLADELERSWQETARMVERAEKAEAELDGARRAVDEALRERDKWRQRAQVAQAERNLDVAQVMKERDEAVRALRGLRREVSARLTGRDSEPGEFERAWQQACAVLAKYPEGT